MWESRRVGKVVSDPHHKKIQTCEFNVVKYRKYASVPPHPPGKNYPPPPWKKVIDPVKNMDSFTQHQYWQKENQLSKDDCRTTSIVLDSPIPVEMFRRIG